MEITYQQVGDYNLPMIAAPETSATSGGIYAQMRLNYLSNHRRALYTNLLTTDKLSQHLNEIETQATHMTKQLIAQMMKSEGVNEVLKTKDRMGWVGQMNNIQARVREVVMAELIYT